MTQSRFKRAYTDSQYLARIYKIRIIDSNGCWIHCNWKTNKSRPQMCYKGKTWNLARLMLKLTLSNFDPNLQANHTCDNKQCWNPEHLYQGTQADNMRDNPMQGMFLPNRF